MKTKQTEVRIETSSQYVEPIIAWLETVGFHGFEETQKGVNAYIESGLFDMEVLLDALSFVPPDQIHLTSQEIEPRNWNEEWEASWENVEIGDFCQIIPSFRSPKPGFAHTLIVDPKMAFGTGHHETTRSVIELIREMDPCGARVLDMGCGTGILGILALKMGASSVLAIDIDPWSVENTVQNAQLNEVDGLQVYEGICTNIPEESYDFIFANINKNVLLNDIPVYASHMSEGGRLLLSGFYEHDEEDILEISQKQGLKSLTRKVQNNWVALSLKK